MNARSNEQSFRQMKRIRFEMHIPLTKDRRVVKCAFESHVVKCRLGKNRRPLRFICRDDCN